MRHTKYQLSIPEKRRLMNYEHYFQMCLEQPNGIV